MQLIAALINHQRAGAWRHVVAAHWQIQDRRRACRDSLNMFVLGQNDHTFVFPVFLTLHKYSLGEYVLRYDKGKMDYQNPTQLYINQRVTNDINRLKTIRHYMEYLYFSKD
ncbi:hypothetical protein HMPREF0758_4065 [Serratia odorifera DSM 4582]|uniref:Uncharacterized protein n=2 Tax=Serratia odorifera TaxID=618 RepID=D4E7B5_SEROD|nr:hypothetical protein HMPREF0758_4065 [Serratia odorifera DSM 4582]